LREMKRLLLFLTLIVTILVLAVSSCQSPNVQDQSILAPGDKLTVEEASKIIGLPIPVPDYFPEGYQITSVEIKAGSIPQDWDITIDIYNSKSAESVMLDISGFALGMKILPGAETFKIGGRTGMVSRQSDYIRFSWTDKMGRGLTLTGNKELQFEELVKIAESVATPPSKILEANLDPSSVFIVLRGDTQKLVIHLQNNSSKSVSVTISNDTEDLPSGIGIKVVNSSLTLKPQQSIDVPVNVKIATDAPSPTWSYQPASTVLSTDTPHPSHPITEDPYYYLQFLISYQYLAYNNTQAEERISLSKILRIDTPSKLPSGMVTLKEAEDAADFPVSLLLPSYFPEGTNPVPIGCKVSSEEPHSITVSYSAYSIVLSPEQGITGPPVDFTGERTVIRKKTAVIGQNRIDWWIYDIHFSVISDEIPMNEL
jgi:hypothetical protein